MNERTILVTAYAVQPYKGSEDGMGWNMIVQIARFNRVIAITRKNNREAIEKYLAEENIPEAENMEFAYFDLPYFLRFLEKRRARSDALFLPVAIGGSALDSQQKLVFRYCS